MKSASRTLVKSPPELWEMIDKPDRMQGLMCALVGRATDVTVDERRPESVLRWQAAGDGDAWIEVKLAEKGWGTNVKVKAENAAEPTKLEGWLDAVLDELATPQKRPFESMKEARAPEVPVTPQPMPQPEKPVAAEPVEEPTQSPAPETPPVAEATPEVEEPQPELEEAQPELSRFRRILDLLK
jgi:hypothetical protein